MELTKYNNECYFLMKSRERPACGILKSFYNYKEKDNPCGDCPFFKTREEYIKGFENVRHR